MLTCHSMTELVTDYLESRLFLRDRLRFQLHLGMCRHCRAYLRQIRATIRTLGRLSTDEIPGEVRQEPRRRFRDWTFTDRP